MNYNKKHKLQNKITIFGKKYNKAEVITDLKIISLFIFILFGILLLLYFQLTDYYQLFHGSGMK
ncbi:MAG: hypothetical protein K2Q21_16055 [Chitinophagaceae bacterium]|nr:hypothetical protein [Chitinophagaceae bacterium]